MKQAYCREKKGTVQVHDDVRVCVMLHSYWKQLQSPMHEQYSKPDDPADRCENGTFRDDGDGYKITEYNGRWTIYR